MILPALSSPFAFPPSRSRSRLSLAPWVAVALLGLFGCADLPPIDADVCGNHVTDGEEDCDEDSAACHPPGAEDECRFACDIESEDDNDGCPEGYGCGVDQVCRAGSGRFLIAEEVYDGAVVELASASFDDDGKDDVFFASYDVSSAMYFNDFLGKAAAATIRRSPSSTAPMLGDIDGDGDDDLVFDLRLGVDFGSGLAVYTSEDDRSMAGQTYISVQVDYDVLRGARVDVLPPATRDEAVAFVQLGAVSGLVGLGDDRVPQLMGTVDELQTTDIVGFQVGQVIEADTSPCEELVVTTTLQQGPSDKVWVIEPCIWTAQNEPEWRSAIIPNRQLEPIVLSLPAGERMWTFAWREQLPSLLSSLLLADFNGDGHLDILATVQTQSGNPGMAIAFGLGTGHFHSTLPLPLLPTQADDTFFVLPNFDDAIDPKCLPVGAPIAAGMINGDNRADLVTQHNVLLSEPPGDPNGPLLPFRVAECEFNWTSAVLGDFDRNGTTDIVASRWVVDPDDDGKTFALASGLDVRVGAGDGSFARSSIPTSGPVLAITAGDFDGDLVTDVGYVQVDEGLVDAEDLASFATRAPDTLYAAFGRTFGGFDTSTKLGTLPRVKQLLSGRFAGGDSTADMLVTSGRPDAADETKEELGLALVAGNPNRQLTAPFTLTVGTTVPRPTEIKALAFGALDDPADESVNSAFAVLTEDATLDGPAANQKDPRARVWLAQQRGDAMDLEASYATEFEEPFRCFRCLLAATDLDGEVDGAIDEVLLLGRQAIAGVEGDISVLEVTTQSDKRVLVPRGGPLNAPFEFVNVDPYNRAALPRVQDLDLDGVPEVITLAANKPYYPGTPLGLVILWNDETGAIDPDAATFLIDAKDSVEGWAALNIDADPDLELVVALERGAFVLQIDSASRTLSPLDDTTPKLQAWYDNTAYELAPELLAAGDFDGDGVTDLFAGDFSGYLVLQGEAVKP